VLPMLARSALRTVGAVGRVAAARVRLSKPLCTAAKAPPPPPVEPGTVGRIMQQLQSEIATANDNPAKLFGFIGACINWSLGLSGMYDALYKGPEVISLKMTIVQLFYSTLFARWAGWAVMPRNYMLAGSHMFNVLSQCNQLRRCLEYKVQEGGEAAKAEVQDLATKAAIGGAVIATAVLSADKIKAVVAPIGPAYLSSAGGPFTIHPWPPVTKLMISGTSMLELDRPTDKISLSQYTALTATGAIFSRYGLVVTPINYPLTSVNVLLFLSSGWHLGRKIKADYL